MPEVSTHTCVLPSTCQLSPRTLCGSMHACLFACVHRDLSKSWTLPCGENGIGRSCHLRYINVSTQTCMSMGYSGSLYDLFFSWILCAFCYSLFSLDLLISFLYSSVSFFFLFPCFLFLSEPDSLIDKATGTVCAGGLNLQAHLKLWPDCLQSQISGNMAWALQNGLQKDTHKYACWKKHTAQSYL